MRKFIFAAMLTLALPMMAQKEGHNFEISKNFAIFNEIYKNLDLLYVDTLNANEVIGYGIRAMLSSLDPYTEYYPEDREKDLEMMTTGKYAGIGAMVRYNSQIKRVVIDEPYANMPATEVGLKKGDVILAIDDTIMTDKEVNYVSDHLRGEPGSTFMLKIMRPSTGKVMKLKVTRRSIQLPAVPYYGMQPGNVGYINLNSFTENCAKAVRHAFIELKEKGAKSLVFDLRGNGGGLLQEAVSIVNMFVPKGTTIVKTKGKIQKVNSEFKTTVEPIDTVMPIVVLVNGNSASASEITSGSLQDLDRAVIIGTRTYGKGLVQNTVPLPYNGNLKLTTSKYYIPSGRCIQAINYKHSNGGYTEHVADSLTHVFHTMGGREVRDGGGIMPDIEVVPDSMPNIAFYLAGVKDSTEVLFNYELDYIKSHPTIATPDKFEISDADYEKFKQCVLKSGFKYDAVSGTEIEKLEKIAKFEGYYDDAKNEFEALRKKLKHNVEKDLDFHKSTIKELLASDIVAAYYYQAGAMENSLRTDKVMKKALEVLADKDAYAKLLQPKQTKAKK